MIWAEYKLYISVQPVQCSHFSGRPCSVSCPTTKCDRRDTVRSVSRWGGSCAVDEGDTVICSPKKKGGGGQKSITRMCICFSTLRSCVLFPFAVFFLELQLLWRQGWQTDRAQPRGTVRTHIAWEIRKLAVAALQGFELLTFLLLAQCEWSEHSHLILYFGCCSCWFLILSGGAYRWVKRDGRFKPVWQWRASAGWRVRGGFRHWREFSGDLLRGAVPQLLPMHGGRALRSSVGAAAVCPAAL